MNKHMLLGLLLVPCLSNAMEKSQEEIKKQQQEERKQQEEERKREQAEREKRAKRWGQEPDPRDW